MLAPIAVLIVAMLSIQTGASFAKNLFPLAGSAGTTALRLFFASLILWLIWRPWKFTFGKSNLKNLTIYGTSIGLMNLTLEFVGPLTLAIFSSRRKIDFLWATLAGLGIYMVMPVSDLSHSLDPIGMLFALTAGMFWAFYIYFGQKVGKDFHGGLAATIGMTFAAFVAIPFGIVIDGSKLLNLSIIPMGIVVAIFSSALPYSLEMYSLKKIPTKTFGILMSLEPAIASLVGLLFLGEQLTTIQWFAITCVVIASLGSALTVPKK